MYENNFPKKRFRITLEFLKQFISKDDRILDLGIINPFSDILLKEGFNVTSTEGEDLDLDTTIVKKDDFDVVTAFQIFEHMIVPFNVLNDAKATKLIASVPLKLWFSSAYRSKTDKWDRHFHEFEDWQFNWLLEKSGWEVKKSIQFTSPVKKIGFRPILRLFTPRFYLVYAERIKN
ncbi:MAG: methyltransferase [Flavobacteriaceae bacterium]|nr:methyltransferase [Flavobacteriaceae bacterium]